MLVVSLGAVVATSASLLVLWARGETAAAVLGALTGLHFVQLAAALVQVYAVALRAEHQTVGTGHHMQVLASLAADRKSVV